MCSHVPNANSASVTGMLFDPAKPAKPDQKQQKELKEKSEVLGQRWQQYKQHLRRRKANKVLQKLKESIFKKSQSNVLS